MLAEIFMLRLEARARAAKEAATITRSTSPFVPVTLAAGEGVLKTTLSFNYSRRLSFQKDFRRPRQHPGRAWAGRQPEPTGLGHGRDQE
jgi:hypothetical protein